MAVSAGNGEAFRLIFDYYHARVYSSAMQVLDDSALSRDICQDVFLKIWLKREQLPGIGNFAGWLYTIARNQIFDVVRSQGKKHIFSLDMAGEVKSSSADAEATLQSREIREVVEQAVELLPEKQKQVYQLIRELGLSRKETAEKLGISPETVKSNLDKSLQKIRAYCIKKLDSDLLLAVGLLFY